MTPASVLAYVRKNPNTRAVDVAAHFGVLASVAGAVLRALRDESKVRSRGNTKGTRYTAR